jgi:hypothetical protein
MSVLGRLSNESNSDVSSHAPAKVHGGASAPADVSESADPRTERSRALKRREVAGGTRSRMALEPADAGFGDDRFRSALSAGLPLASLAPRCSSVHRLRPHISGTVSRLLTTETTYPWPFLARECPADRRPTP